MTFGEKIQKLRKEAGMSQEELSYQLEVSRQAISKWERDNGYPETEKIIRVSKLFNVSLDYLLDEEDTQRPEIDPEENDYMSVGRWQRDFFFIKKGEGQKLVLRLVCSSVGYPFPFGRQK